MSSNDVPLSSAVATIEQMQVPAEQMQIDGIQGLPLAAQTLLPENNTLEAPMFHLPASLAEQPSYTSVFAPLQTMQATVEAVTLQSPESHSTSIKVCGGLLESYDYVGPDSDNYKDVMQHMNEAAKECKQAEIKYKTEVEPQLSKDNLELQKHRGELTVELEKFRHASMSTLSERATQLATFGTNHQQNMIVTKCNHVLNVMRIESNLEEKKISLEEKKINLKEKKINLELEMAKLNLEKMKEKKNKQRCLKPLQPKKHRGGGLGRGRHQSQSKPVVEEVEDAKVEEVDDSERYASIEPF